jgi:hypothetical protein
VNPSVNKRHKELARQQHQREKAERKKQRRADADKERPGGAGGVDPDIASIVPGPQPRADEE